jgi:hypothetical protein
MQGGQDQSAHQSCPARNFRGFLIPDFSHHNDIRVLPQKRPKRRRKGQANGLIHLHLFNAVQLVFDWVFDGQDFPVLRVQMRQSGV